MDLMFHKEQTSARVLIIDLSRVCRAIKMEWKKMKSEHALMIFLKTNHKIAIIEISIPMQT